MKFYEHTHRRKNPLSGDWVLVSPHRNNRPWAGATEDVAVEQTASYDEECPLCPGNRRGNSETNEKYENTFVFKNDFAALGQVEQVCAQINDPLFQAESASGECRVICFSPEHNKSIPELSVSEVSKVVEAWQQNFIELSKQYTCVHIFENKGEIMGCSQPHPHGQIWAHQHLSSEIEKENKRQLEYFQENGSNLLADYVERELIEKKRIVAENEHWLVVVPFWAAWPFETLLVAKNNVQYFGELDDPEKYALAKILKELTTKYDNVFNCSFAYSMGWHSAPMNLESNDHWRLHAHFYPPLLRSASIKKHMVGYEMLAESQRDLSAETAAELLRSASTKHYKQGQ